VLAAFIIRVIVVITEILAKLLPDYAELQRKKQPFLMRLRSKSDLLSE
jgi:hypothetical protein